MRNVLCAVSSTTPEQVRVEGSDAARASLDTPPKVRILHYLCTCRVEDGGVPKAAIDLADQCARAGSPVRFLTWDPQVCPQAWKDGTAVNLTLRVVPRPSLPGAIFDPAQLAVFEDEIKACDVLHLHAMWTPSNVQLAIAAKALGKAYIISPHGMLDDWCMEQNPLVKRGFLALVGTATLQNAAFVHCTAEAEFVQARRWIPHARGLVLPLVMDLEPYRVLPGPQLAQGRFCLNSDVPQLLFLSRVHPKKGVGILIRAAALLRDRGVKFELLIAGPDEGDYGQKMRRLTEDLSLGERVRFLGPVVGAEKVSLYQHADVFVLPSYQENFGFVFFEALAAGTAVVTTKNVDTWEELVNCGGSKAFTMGGDERQSAIVLSETLEELLRSRSELAAMGARGRSWVLDQLDAATVIGRYQTAYARAAGIDR